MNICSVIVTYGDRFNYLIQVVEALKKEGIYKIIIIDNNSAQESKNNLFSLEEKNKNIKVISLDENTGSAGGYKRGLEEVLKYEDIDFVWLLDDDNKPLDNSLHKLKTFWNTMDLIGKEEKICLLSCRDKHISYAKAAIEKNPKILMGNKNDFMGFHIKDIFQIIYRKIFPYKNNYVEDFDLDKLNLEMKNKKFGELELAPYGGMFFNIKLLKDIGLPNQDFYLYCDDYEYSYRITKSGGSILLIYDSKVDDLIMSENSAFRAYYNTRNIAFFKRNYYSSNKFIYNLNYFIYKFVLKLKKNKNTVLVTAAENGYKGVLGKVADEALTIDTL